MLAVLAATAAVVGTERAPAQNTQAPSSGAEAYVAHVEQSILKAGSRIAEEAKAASTISQWAADKQILGQGETPKEQVAAVMKGVLQPLAGEIGQRSITATFTPQRAKPYEQNKALVAYCIEGELRRADLPLQEYMTSEQLQAWRAAEGTERKKIEAEAQKLKDERETLKVAAICLPAEAPEAAIRSGRPVVLSALLLDLSVRGQLGAKAAKHETVIARRLLIATPAAYMAMSTPAQLGASDTAAVTVRWRK